MTQFLSIIILIISVVVHEYAHAWMAKKCGDNTASEMGRLTLNPLPHLDILGSILLPGLLIFSGAPFLIGWAKPVPVNVNRLNSPLRDMMYVAVAGPVSNIILVCLFYLTYLFFGHVNNLVILICILTIQLNLVLAFFNLIPIPPLDGSRIIVFFLPENIRQLFYRLEPYGFVILFIFIYFDLLDFIYPKLVLPILEILF